MALSIADKFANALSHINAMCPGYLNFYGLMSHRQINDEKVTIRTNMMDDIHAMLEYNPAFIDKISSQTLSYLIVTELNRILLHHCTKRRMPNAKINYFASNIVCCDSSNNSLFSLNEETADLARSMPNDNNPMIKKLLGPDYRHDRDCVLEILYGLLTKQLQSGGNGGKGQSQNINSDGSNDGEGQSQDINCNGFIVGEGQDINGDGSIDGEGEGQDSNGEGKPSKGRGRQKHRGGTESEQTKQEREALKQHFGTKNAEQQTEKWGDNDLANSEIAQRVRKMDPTDWGNMPASLRDKIIAANVQVIDPRKPLKNFIATAYSNNMVDTRMKPSRRMPEYIGKIPGKRHTQEFKLGVFADASGSMGQENLELAIACINQFIRNGSIVEYGWWDCSCTKPERQLKPMPDAECIGGGGTDPQCILQMMKENKLNYDGIIVITDCGFDWPKPKEYKKIFIIRTPNAIDAPEWVGDRQMTMKDVHTIMDKQ